MHALRAYVIFPDPKQSFSSLSLSLSHERGFPLLTAKSETLELFSQMLSVLAMILNR